MPPSAENVAIFWDYENCAIPANLTGYEAADAIRRVARGFGSVTMFKAYLEVSEQVSSPRSMSLRSELQASGVSLTDCPHNGRKDVADKMMIVDMLAYAIDNPPPTTFMLISGDRDFSYALSILRLRRYRVALITPPNTHISLTTQASHHLLWTSDVLDISTNTPSKPPKKEPRTPARVLSPPARVNFASATPSSRRNTDTSFTRDRAAASPTKGMLAPPTPTDPEQTLVMGEGSKRREPRVRTRLGERGQGGSMPSIIGEEPQSPSPKSSRREPVTVTSFFGTPFRLPRTPPSRFETSSFGQFTDRKGKARESASPQPFVQTPLTARHGLSYLQTRQPTPRSPLVEAVNAPLPQSPLSDVYQEGHGSDSASDRPPSSELGAEYEDDIPWESHSRPPSEPLSPRTDFQNSVAPYGDSSNENTDSLISPPSNAGSPLRNSRMPDGSPKRVVPFRFKPLVLQLQDCRKDGSYIPPRSQLSEKLEARFQPVERIYQNAGVEGFDEYIDLAEQEGFVTTGGGDGPVEAWIMLRQEWVASLC